MKAHKKELLSNTTKPVKTESKQTPKCRYKHTPVLACRVFLIELYYFRQDHEHFPLRLASVKDRIFSEILLNYKFGLI